HGIYILADFFLKTAALRNGKLHLVMAAPALSWSGSEQAEDSDLGKLLVGGRTQQKIRNRFVRILLFLAAGSPCEFDPGGSEAGAPGSCLGRSAVNRNRSPQKREGETSPGEPGVEAIGTKPLTSLTASSRRLRRGSEPGRVVVARIRT